MTRWRMALVRAATLLGRALAVTRSRLRAVLGLRRPPRVVAYRGYGTRLRVRVSGRVEERWGRPAPRRRGELRSVLRQSFQRVTAPPVPGARIRVAAGGEGRVLRCSHHGYFDAWVEPEEPLEDGRLWHRVQIAPVEPPGDPAEAEILTPLPASRLVVVSDVDDTVVPTGATSFLSMMRSVFLTDARTRPPFPGVAAFYRALHDGVGGDEHNPVVYVSRGPWVLYEVLSEMLRAEGLPKGPVLFLRKWGLSAEGLTPARPRGHKFSEVRTVLDTFAGLPAVLVGDSGQLDPEIYTEIVHGAPGRVRAVYIRAVEPDAERRRAIDRLAEAVDGAGSELVLAADTAAMARHAADLGLIDGARVNGIVAEVERDLPAT